MIFYYAITDANNVVTAVVDSDIEINQQNYIRIASDDQQLVGKEYYKGEFVELPALRLMTVATINNDNICNSVTNARVRRLKPGFIEVTQPNKDVLGFVYDVDSNTFSAPITKPVFELTDLQIDISEQHGAIHWLPVETVFTLTAKSKLPAGELMVMIEKIIKQAHTREVKVIDDTRVKTLVDENGNITMRSLFRNPGNWRITAERLNEGLNEIGAPFNLAFNEIEIDAYETA